MDLCHLNLICVTVINVLSVKVKYYYKTFKEKQQFSPHWIPSPNPASMRFWEIPFISLAVPPLFAIIVLNNNIILLLKISSVVDIIH